MESTDEVCILVEGGSLVASVGAKGSKISQRLVIRRVLLKGQIRFVCLMREVV